ncbi:hypothetical protein [Hydrogenophaga sp. BPS33]|uniref:hypothetical protein n=1 Tax=Hydrogenophaga sp. BPS33 TaxID=2651974 RepID=UPI00131FF9BF|nr:hypothetical protein [Hydrogenophaga sp. BPS33]QHE87188.1 hypothetical protein F9K07_20935 [Hydrogenophaga sp. BPS33]
MPIQTSPTANNGGTFRLPSLPPARQGTRVLVVFEGTEHSLPSEVATTLLSTLLPNVAVDQACIAAPDAYLDILSSQLMTLNHYRLILVASERLRIALRAALPSLSDRIYRLDHFGDLSAEGSTAKDKDDVSHELSLQQGLSHWSVCLSQLLNSPSWYRLN